MKIWASLVLLAALTVAAPSLPAQAQQPPLTKDQVLNLVRNQLGEEAGARAILKRGLDFIPAEAFLNAVRDAGATDVFIQALRAAAKAKSASPAVPKPLSQVHVLELLTAKVSGRRVAMLIEERGIDFEPTGEFLDIMRGYGAEGLLRPVLLRARVIRPKELDPYALARQTQLQEHTARGIKFQHRKQFAEAEEEFRLALELDPSKSELHYLLGNSLMDQQKYDDAIAEFREGLRLNPTSELPQHHDLGLALEFKGDVDGAIAEYRESIRVNPSQESASTNLGFALIRKGDLAGAIAAGREAVRMNPENDAAHTNLGYALDLKGDLDGAMAEYREAVRLNPTGDMAHNNLGYSLYRKGDLDGAIAEVHEALRLNPDNSIAHESLGEFLIHKGDLDEAIAQCREALRLNPKQASAHHNLGVALERRVDLEAALQEYRTAHTLDPQEVKYKQSYERLLQKLKQ